MFRRVFTKKLILLPLIFLLTLFPSFSQNYNDLDELEQLINSLMQEEEQPLQPETQEPDPQIPPQYPQIPQTPLDTEDAVTIEETVTSEPQEADHQIEPEPQPGIVPQTEPQQPQSELPSEQSEPTEPSESSQSPESTEEPRQLDALAMIRYKNSDTISFKFKLSYIPKPYILGLSLAAGYTEYKMLQPFYFGGYLEPHLGIPQKDFPFKYEQNGSAISGPLIIGGKLYAPFGICVFSFQQNIEVFVEFEPGITLDMLWNTKFGKKAITSKLYPAFYAAIRTGATYKGFTAFVEGNYDAVLGFGVSIGIGYSFNVNFERQSSQTDLPDLAE